MDPHEEAATYIVTSTFTVTPVLNDLSDIHGEHLPLCDDRPLKRTTSSWKSIRLMNKESLEIFNHKLQHEDWSLVNRAVEEKGKIRKYFKLDATSLSLVVCKLHNDRAGQGESSNWK
ncbi:uncharacterized protein LOC126412580 [Schistocerca serialis cubense]|uniref:uncharacterized protein LOC126412580 n=1 Tax=Schistocerca serialis cubense TaxID=2023355 RepID=UPI00214E5457|nr:uncharacterized protein LOC126412580 [Schistocerca serialis cubense]